MPGDCRLIGGAAGGGPDRNPAREAKRQRDYLKDYFNNEGAVAWHNGRYNSCCSNQSFSGLITSPFKDYQIFQKQLINCACSKYYNHFPT